jgi:hypothetical protein
MPTTTFEHLGTTTVSGSSTTEVSFTSIDQTTYKNFIVFGCAMFDSVSQQLCVRVGGSSSNSYLYQNTYAGNSSNGSAVQVTPRYTSTSWALTQYNINTSTYPTAFKVTFSANSTGVTQMIAESGLWAAADGQANFNITNGRFAADMPSIQIIGDKGGAFKAGSVFSLYGLI